MKQSIIWFTSYHGSLYTYNLNSFQWQRISGENTNSRKDTFKRISSTSACAWAVGGDQNVYTIVFNTDLPIKVSASTYENQRWSPRHGWSEKSLLFTDRWSWSSKNGKVEILQDDQKLRSSAWIWEGSWFVDHSIDCDEEGWQYAVDFPASYYKQPGRLSFVRRRKWSRYQKFIGFCQWLKVPLISSNDPFQDISIGGDQLHGQLDGFLCVWAITFSGKVLFREGVTRVSPCGERWLEVPINDMNLVQVSVGPTGLLWCCTWDGNAVVRCGITHKNPAGTTWVRIEAPHSNPLFQVSVGLNALWAITKDSKVFFRRGIQVENIKTTTDDNNWVEMCGSFLFISVTPNDQVFAIGREDRQLYVRTYVTADELVGREWKVLKFSASLTKDQEMFQWYWVECGSCCIEYSDLSRRLTTPSINNQKYLTYTHMDSKWRNDVLKSLCQRNNKEMISTSAQYLEVNAQKNNIISWSKRCQCRMLLDKLCDIWCTCHIKFFIHPEENSTSLIVYYKLQSTYKELIFFIKDLSCIYRTKHPTRSHVLSLQIAAPDLQIVMFHFETEKTLLEWMSALNDQNTRDLSLPFFGSTRLWAISKLGDIFHSDINFSSPSEIRWKQICGHLKRVTSGLNLLTWAIDYDGKAHTYTNDSTQLFEWSSTEEHIIYENQRWNPVEGYTNRLLPSDRWAWSDVSGAYNCFKENYVLPSSNYKWCSDWCIYDDDTTDKDGWQYAVDFPRNYHKKRGLNDYVRRRKWKRLCQVSCSGPWCPISSDMRLVDLSISVDQTFTSRVWGVSCNGDVVIREGVDDLHPQGTAWCNLPTTTPIVALSIGVRNRVWCVAKDGSCYLRIGFTQLTPFGSSWIHIMKVNEHILRKISLGRYIVLSIDEQDNLLYRCDVSDTYPEGTMWKMLHEDVSSVSVNSQDQVCMVHRSQVIICDINLKESEISMRKLFTVLLDGWIEIDCRALSIVCKDKENEASKQEHMIIKDVNSCTMNNTDDITNDVKVDPYSVDIYQFYS